MIILLKVEFFFFFLAKMYEPVIEQSMDETMNDVVVSDTLQDLTHEMTST